MIVMLIGMVALLIAIGMVSRVSRLTKSSIEQEAHEEAYSKADEIIRSIIDLIDSYPTGTEPETIAGIAVGTTEGVEYTAVKEYVLSDGIVLEDGRTYELGLTSTDSGSVTMIVPELGSGSYLLISLFTETDMFSTIVDSCSAGYLGVPGLSCSDSGAGFWTITYNVSSADVSLRIRVVNTSVRILFDGDNDNGVASDNIPVAHRYTITVRQTTGDDSTGEGSTSETTLVVPTVRVLPTFFDYVLFNGSSAINK